MLAMREIAISETSRVKKIEDNITLAVTSDDKVVPVNIVYFSVSEDEDAGDFFSSSDSTEKKYATILCDKDILNWFSNDKDDLKTESIVNLYPEEMKDIIHQGISKTSQYNIEKDRTWITNIKDDMFLKSENLLAKATVEFNNTVNTFKNQSGNGANLETLIDRYYFKKHLLIRGAKGVGKTYAVDKRLNDDGIDYEFIAGHEGMESIDLLGYYIKDELGNLVWLDGALSRAFRKAKDDRCAIFFDEILRMPSRELNILVGALTPSSNNTYRLRTNRVVNTLDSIGETEIIEVPIENLWCVATTNIGAGYQVDDIDDALSDRFRICDKNTNTDELNTILMSYAGTKISNTKVNELITFYTQTNDLVKSGELEKEVNLRHLSETVQYANNDDEIKIYMLDLIPTWCSTDADGSLNKAEKEIIKKMIKKCIK